MKKMFHFSCMKKDLENRPLETNRLYGQRRLAAPHFTLVVSRPDSREILGNSPSTDHKYRNYA